MGKGISNSNERLRKIDICVGFDQNYYDQFGTLATSILSTKDPRDQIVFHAITTGLGDKLKDDLQAYLNNADSKIEFHDFDPDLVVGLVTDEKWSPAVYYRLFFPLKLEKQCPRLLYLDADTIVLRSLWPLFSIDLEKHPVAAVYDNYVKTQSLIGINEEGNYFNSGVMVIDSRLWNHQKISTACCDYLRRYPERILYVDQCGLNAVLRNNWLPIDRKFNLLYSYVPWSLSRLEKDELLSETFIIHYTLQRPWNMLCRNPLRDQYRKNFAAFPHKSDQRPFNDFSVFKLPNYLKIRLFETYNNSKILLTLNKLRKTLHEDNGT